MSALVAAPAVIRRVLYVALAPLVPLFTGVPACFYKRIDNASGLVAALTSQPPTLASAIQFFPPPNGGEESPFFGQQDYSGLWSIRALAGSLNAAEALLATVPPALAALPHPTGYRIQAQIARSQDLPTIDGVVVAAFLTRITLAQE